MDSTLNVLRNFRVPCTDILTRPFYIFASCHTLRHAPEFHPPKTQLSGTFFLLGCHRGRNSITGLRQRGSQCNYRPFQYSPARSFQYKSPRSETALVAERPEARQPACTSCLKAALTLLKAQQIYTLPDGKQATFSGPLTLCCRATEARDAAGEHVAFGAC